MAMEKQEMIMEMSWKHILSNLWEPCIRHVVLSSRICSSNVVRKQLRCLDRCVVMGNVEGIANNTYSTYQYNDNTSHYMYLLL